TFNDEAARALVNSRALSRLDGLFSGCVDEYHGAAYSPGFTKDGLQAVRKAAWMRPACKATCSDFSAIHDYFESDPFDESAELSDGDIRGRPYTLNDKEAEPAARGMQQLPAQSLAEQLSQKEKPPEICRVLPELEPDAGDIIEGLEFRDPTPTTDKHLTLRL